MRLTCSVKLTENYKHYYEHGQWWKTAHGKTIEISIRKHTQTVWHTGIWQYFEEFLLCSNIWWKNMQSAIFVRVTVFRLFASASSSFRFHGIFPFCSANCFVYKLNGFFDVQFSVTECIFLPFVLNRVELCLFWLLEYAHFMFCTHRLKQKKMDFGPWTISYEPYFHFFIYLFTSLAGIFSRFMKIFCTYTFNPFIKIKFLRCNSGERDWKRHKQFSPIKANSSKLNQISNNNVDNDECLELW